ncbi:putative lipid II flippase FtsW [uncultured Mailhella sp.]|uniref:putative lipid II flippase FtsW n=1 Tax=uncultured Mailhella sp. TaxID=1981031 RepID=UPI00261B0ADB|nr:putative lipid II flippase FtsW [uncultured Mailhella sp.]
MNVRRKKNTDAQELAFGPVDWWLVALFLLLLCFGLLAVLTASGPASQRTYGETYHFFHRQLITMLLGGVIVAWLCWVPRRFINRLHYVGIFSVIILLLLCLLIGPTINGSKRWLDLHFMMLQPMEFTRVALVLYFAYFMSSKQSMIKEFSRGLLPPSLITLTVCILLILQPDLGGTIIMLALLFFMCLAGGTRGWYLVSVLILTALLVAGLIAVAPYRMARLMAFLDPFQDAKGAGYQIVQSLYALGSGGFFGKGIGGSIQKTGYLPEAHNDFILSVIGEEVGFVGITVIMVLFALFLYRCYRVALGQKDLRDRLSAYGLTLVIGLSFLLNLAVILGSIPPKGVAMPFFSYGGSSLLSNMICVGLLLNYSRTARE